MKTPPYLPARTLTALSFSVLLCFIACSSSSTGGRATQISQPSSTIKPSEAATGFAPSDFDLKFNKLEVGLTTDAVSTSLGPPTLREVISGVEIWHYSVAVTKSSPKKMEFKQKKLTGFSIDQEALSQMNTKSSNTEDNSVNRQIGDECNVDDQCESKNCHFHLCAGKNNCTRVADQVCANNNDCCTGLCDFGKCKERHW